MRDDEHWEDSAGDSAPDAIQADALDATLLHAIHYRESGDLDILRALVRRRTRREGRRGAETQCALSQMGRTLRAMGRVEEACDLHWEVLAIRLQAYGHFDDFTQNSAAILADTLEMLPDGLPMARAVQRWAQPISDPSPEDVAARTEVDRHLKEAMITRQKYGEQGLRDRCYSLLFQQPSDAEYPEGIDSIATDILNRLGDESTLQRLIETRLFLLDSLQATQPVNPGLTRQVPLQRCERLIAEICKRTNKSLPPGVAASPDEGS